MTRVELVGIPEFENTYLYSRVLNLKNLYVESQQLMEKALDLMKNREDFDNNIKFKIYLYSFENQARLKNEGEAMKNA